MIIARASPYLGAMGGQRAGRHSLPRCHGADAAAEVRRLLQQWYECQVISTDSAVFKTPKRLEANSLA